MNPSLLRVPLPLKPIAAYLAASRRLVIFTVVFVLAYWACNEVTQWRPHVYRGVFPFERYIPFLPWTIVPYLSIIGLFVVSFFVGGGRAALRLHVGALFIDLALSIACYVLVPLRFQYDRPALDGVWGWLFDLLGQSDLPYNRAPSLHISVLVLLWVRLMPRVQGVWRLALGAWLIAIGVSTLTTWQHHLIDIPAGVAVGCLSVWLAKLAAQLRIGRVPLWKL